MLNGLLEQPRTGHACLALHLQSKRGVGRAASPAPSVWAQPGHAGGHSTCGLAAAGVLPLSMC